MIQVGETPWFLIDFFYHNGINQSIYKELYHDISLDGQCDSWLTSSSINVGNQVVLRNIINQNITK